MLWEVALSPIPNVCTLGQSQEDPLLPSVCRTGLTVWTTFQQGLGRSQSKGRDAEHFQSTQVLSIRKTGRCSLIEPLPAHSMGHLEHKDSRPKKRDSVGVPSPSRGVNKGKCWTAVITHDSKIAHHRPTGRKAPEGCENAGKNNGFRDGPFVVCERSIPTDCKTVSLVQRVLIVSEPWKLVLGCSHGREEAIALSQNKQALKLEMWGRDGQQLSRRLKH